MHVKHTCSTRNFGLPPQCMRSALFWNVTQRRLVGEDGTNTLFRNVGS